MRQLVKVFPGAGILSFEPYPVAFSRLQENARLFPNVATHSLALGERDGETTLFLSQASVTNSLLPTSPNASSYSPEGWTDSLGNASVPILTLDTFCARQLIGKIDILNINAQGYEMQILQGAENLLAGAQIGYIYLEIIFVPLYDGQATFDELCRLLRKHGYQFMDLYEKNIGDDGILHWCNAMFRAPRPT